MKIVILFFSIIFFVSCANRNKESPKEQVGLTKSSNSLDGGQAVSAKALPKDIDACLIRVNSKGEITLVEFVYKDVQTPIADHKLLRIPYVKNLEQIKILEGHLKMFCMDNILAHELKEKIRPEQKNSDLELISQSQAISNVFALDIYRDNIPRHKVKGPPEEFLNLNPIKFSETNYPIPDSNLTYKFKKIGEGGYHTVYEIHFGETGHLETYSIVGRARRFASFFFGYEIGGVTQPKFNSRPFFVKEYGTVKVQWNYLSVYSTMLMEKFEDSAEKFIGSSKINSKYGFRDIISGVFFMHKEHVTHNDLNPKNVFIDKEGHFHIGDLDAAQISELNFFHSFPGTRFYSAPERLEKEKNEDYGYSEGFDPFKSDIYSAGLTLSVIFYKINLLDMIFNDLIQLLNQQDPYQKLIVSMLEPNFETRVNAREALFRLDEIEDAEKK